MKEAAERRKLEEEQKKQAEIEKEPDSNESGSFFVFKNLYFSARMKRLGIISLFEPSAEAARVMSFGFA